MCIQALIPLGMAMTGGAAAGTTAAVIGTATAASMAAGALGAVSSFQQGKYQEKVSENNAKTYQAMAQDAIDRGVIAEQNQRRQTAQIHGEQRANMGAMGIDISSGSAVGILGDTVQFGELDAMTIRSNAEREAWGLNLQASNSRSEGKQARMAGTYNAAGTLLSTAGTVGRDWYMFNSGTPDPYADIWRRTTTRGAPGPTRN